MVGKSLISYLKKHKIYTLVNALMIIATTVSALIPPKLLELLVNQGLEDKNKLLILSIFYMLSYLLVGLVALLKNILIYKYSQNYLLSLRELMTRHLVKISYDAFTVNEPGKLEAYFDNDVNSLNDLLTTGIIDMITNILKTIGIIISIFIYSYLLGLMLLVTLPFLLLFIFMIKKGMLKALLNGKKANAMSNEILLENITNMEQIKVNKGQSFAKRRFLKAINDNYTEKQKINFYDAFFAPMMELIKYSLIGVMMLLSGFNGNVLGMNIGMVAASISLITDLFAPLTAIAQEVSLITDSFTSVKRINTFFSLKTIDDGFLSPKGYDIKIANMSFSYDNKKVFADYNLIIPYKSHILLRGESGAGKSTLMKLIMGMLKPTKGDVTIGDAAASLISRDKRVNLFAIFYQDTFFNGGTVYEEVTLLDNTISKDNVQKALEKVGLGYIKDIDKPLNAKDYSTGELALFNLARVIVRDAKIIFIDELGAKLDPLTIDHIRSVLDEYAKDKTLISISHHKDIISDAKEIFIEPLNESVA